MNVIFPISYLFLIRILTSLFPCCLFGFVFYVLRVNGSIVKTFQGSTIWRHRGHQAQENDMSNPGQTFGTKQITRESDLVIQLDESVVLTDPSPDT